MCSTKFVLPTTKDLKFPTQYIPDIKNLCNKIIPLIDFCKKQIDFYNQTAFEILNKRYFFDATKFSKIQKEKRSIISSLVTGFISLAYEDISSYLHNKRQRALHQAFMVMENKVNLECNTILNLEGPRVIYTIYNSDTVEKLIGHNV